MSRRACRSAAPRRPRACPEAAAGAPKLSERFFALGRELFAADALGEGRLVRLSPRAPVDGSVYSFWWVYLPERADLPPLAALRHWLHAELAASLQELRATSG